MSCLFAEVRMQIGRRNKALEGGKVAEVREEKIWAGRDSEE